MQKKLIIIILFLALVAIGYNFIRDKISISEEEDAVLSGDFILQEDIELFEELDLGLPGIDEFEDLEFEELDIPLALPDFDDLGLEPIVSETSIILDMPDTGDISPDTSNLDISISGFSGSSSGSSISASECAQFSAVLFCSYISSTQGRILCEQCKDAGD